MLQGSDNEGLGLGGGTFGGMMSARGSANLLSRLTAITATLFMVMAIILNVMSRPNEINSSVSNNSGRLQPTPGDQRIAMSAKVIN